MDFEWRKEAKRGMEGRGLEEGTGRRKWEGVGVLTEAGRRQGSERKGGRGEIVCFDR